MRSQLAAFTHLDCAFVACHPPSTEPPQAIAEANKKIAAVLAEPGGEEALRFTLVGSGAVVDVCQPGYVVAQMSVL